MISIPKGTKDVLPQDSYKWHYVEDVVKGVARSFNIKESFGKNTNLHEQTINLTPFLFTFDKGSGSTNPMSTKDNGGYIALYQNNTMKITNATNMTKVEFTLSKGALTSDVGSVSNNVWEGDAKEIVFTATSSTFITAMKITYVDPDSSLPVVEGVSTIAEVYEAASQISYVPNAVGWHLSTVEVTVEVEALDAIDSKSEGVTKGYDPNARGKVLVADETGYIICSSGITKNNPISFYQRVKSYIKAGTTQYVVTGHIAFFNGVVEIKVSEYQYNSSLDIHKDYEGYVKHTFDKQEEYVNDVINNTVTNEHGYGVNDVVKFTGLTYFNKYNDAGSYLFLDQEGKIVPVYSLLDKDRASLIEGKVYDIIGLESMYYNRPSLRILKVDVNNDAAAQKYDFVNDVTSITSLDQFFDLTMSSTNLNYIKSELTVYSAEVYVSRYTEEQYSFNTSYYYDNTFKEYTTGSSLQAIAEHKSLRIYNDNLTYNQTLMDFLLEDCQSDEECSSSKVTLYFTLTDIEVAFGKNVWRVNIFEDLVLGLDYYYSESKDIVFDTDETTCEREDGVYQEWKKDGLSVKNESTEYATISRSTDYLKIESGTKLTIKFDKEIVAFTLYMGTYSHIAGLGSLEIYTYRLFSTYGIFVLAEPTKEVVIDELLVSATGNSTYLKVDSMTINYIG